ncbi:GDP-mannose 4,6-dehydratase [Thalassospira sp. ER-Se-21-Dark]|uniref:GDP-mannose 4,6-dehydratase n=1 Tax=Thalassospira sp. ER-Se-21-Dark TaxID=2585190 RepID=UPI001B316F17|nr:GDP-mannose 4,6-dehydratase [Thalassospira sp. ER-Se-21-Dark]MBP3128253.1 GDP-mannose 4,6-dehydratase [Thalassospira sp. ER-Se-21-Dark]
MKRALIFGVSGQDGSYLSRLLLNKGYEVHGTSRDATVSSFVNLSKLKIKEHVHLHSMSPVDFRSVLQTIEIVEPDEIYNLAGQSSVGLSFEQPVETLESVAMGTLNMLEAIRFLGSKCRFYNASSSECFGEAETGGSSESSPFRPRSPYAVAKATAFWEVSSYREAYDLFACSGILFNHESSLRPERFVTKKIIKGALDVKKGKIESISLGDLSVERDWGWAPEYVEAMWLMLQQQQPDDFVIGTGVSNSIQEFVELAFDHLGLNWKDHVKLSDGFKRPSDIRVSRANPEKAFNVLGWKSTIDLDGIVKKMLENEC